MAIKYLNKVESYPVKKLCALAHLNRSSYYKWLKREPSQHQRVNEQIAEWIKELYEEQKGILGYRQMTITLNREHNTQYNHKRIYRLMNVMSLKSVCRRKRYKYIRSTPEVTAENILNREFYAEKPNEKWLTDVTEFKYYIGEKVRKLYLSAIYDLYDRRIVAYRIGPRNNNELVFESFDEAIRENPGAHPLLHSDRGFQYTSRKFKEKLEMAGMEQSMSRVGRCIDNGPMEGFWGIMKTEMYYRRKYRTEEEITEAIEKYINFYNRRRYQRRLKSMTPLEYHDRWSAE